MLADYRTDVQEISVKESAFHTRTNRFYALQATDSRGWPFLFEELHHRKAVIVNLDITKTTKDEVATLRKISDEIAPRDGTRIIAFPSGGSADEIRAFFDSCGVHRNDASFQIMAPIDPATHPVFNLLTDMANIDSLQNHTYFYINRNSHLQGVATAATTILAVLQDELRGRSC